MEYQPKGGMCAVCTKKNDDCSGLDFESMPKHTLGYSTTVVICTDFVKEKK